jgi:zinc transport system substrate-binding protein
MLLGILVTTVLISAGCAERPSVQQPAHARLSVFVGIPPTAYLVEQIGGKYVRAEVLVQPGQDPHTFEPMPRQISELSRAALFFKIGMPFENVLVEKIQEGNPRLVVIDTDRGIKKLTMEATSDHERYADKDHDHDVRPHGELDPHIWLAPSLLKIQADHVAAGLIQADPKHAEEYRRNLTDLLNRIDATHARIQKRLSSYRGRRFYVFHPGFAYFADAYGLQEVAVETCGRSPTPKELRSLIERAATDGVTTVFIQPQYDPHSAQVLAESLGGRVVSINGLEENVLHDLEDIAVKVEEALKGR